MRTAWHRCAQVLHLASADITFCTRVLSLYFLSLEQLAPDTKPIFRYVQTIALITSVK